MNDKKHIAVIGGGITGLHAMRILTERGFRVTLFEKDKNLLSGLSSIISEIHGGAEYPPKRTSISLRDYLNKDFSERPSIFGERKNATEKIIGYWTQRETDFTKEQLQSGKDCLTGLIALKKYDAQKLIFGRPTNFYISAETEKFGEITRKRKDVFIALLLKFMSSLSYHNIHILDIDFLYIRC